MKVKQQRTIGQLESMFVTQCREALSAHRAGDDFHLYTRAEVMRQVCGMVCAELKERFPEYVREVSHTAGGGFAGGNAL